MLGGPSKPPKQKDYTAAIVQIRVIIRDDRDGNVPWKRNIVFCGAAT